MIGTRDYRLEAARKWGADYILNTKDEKSPYYTKDLKSTIADLTHGLLADRAINPTSSNAAFEQSIDITGGAAIIVHFGLPNADDVIHIPADATHKADKEIRFSWLAPGVWPTTIRMISEGLLNLEPLVSRSVPLSEAAAAIRSLKAREGDPIKVQVTP
jgi:threonine dehydrogenase-like Zn-dependent dehydrogenase